MFNAFTSCKWHLMTEDSITSGFLGNLFLFEEANKEQHQFINAQVSLAQSGNNTFTHADAKEMLKLSVNLPRKKSQLTTSSEWILYALFSYPMVIPSVTTSPSIWKSLKDMSRLTHECNQLRAFFISNTYPFACPSIGGIKQQQICQSTYQNP